LDRGALNVVQYCPIGSYPGRLFDCPITPPIVNDKILSAMVTVPANFAPNDAAFDAAGDGVSHVGVGVVGPSFSPLYQQIKVLILRSLQAGEWRPGEAIPSEIDLAGRFKVSQGTVRKAVDELAAENLLTRRQGKGTFVATHAEEQVQYRFLRLMPDQTASKTGSTKREFLDCRRLRAPADVARALHIKSGDMVVEIRRVLHFSDQPVVYDDIWLPGRLFKGLTADRLSEYRGPMYGLFESEFGVRMIRAEEHLRAVAATADTAQALMVEQGSPLLSVERLSFTYGDQPVELRRGLYRTDHHYYRNELS
jgi:GntR family transcriptional regulator